jgi:hypothetical protein
VSLDGQRFLALKAEEGTGGVVSSEVYLVTNWFQELLELMGN